MLIDRAIQIGPAAVDLDTGFIDETAVTRQPAARPGGFIELTGEALHPPVHRHVIDANAAFGK
jgi:hypothetical protein